MSGMSPSSGIFRDQRVKLLKITEKLKKIIFFTLIFGNIFLFGFRQGEPEGFSNKLSDAAIARTEFNVRYDGSYMKIDYPGGDVPPGIGVCTDVIIRSYCSQYKCGSGTGGCIVQL